MSGSKPDKHQKTEDATPKKRRDARRDGQVAKSQDIAAWVTVLAATLLLPITIGRSYELLQRLVRQMGDVIAAPEQGTALALFGSGLWSAVLVVVPLSLGLLVVAVLATVLQVGFKPTPKPLKPQFSRLNPLPGIKRIVGPDAIWEGAKALIKLLVLLWLAYYTLSTFVPALLDAGRLSLFSVLASVADAALTLIRTTAIVGLVLAVADYVVQRRKLDKKLRMTMREVKDENKNAEGDPQLKGAIRDRQLAMSRNRMMSDVGSADVVVVNPTHVAVALSYDPSQGAPRVVAKGSGHVAARIRERADEHRVPLVRDVPLARALHRACEVGEHIPAELFTAVAQVLAFVFSLRSRGAAAGLHTVPPAQRTPAA